MRIRSGHVGFLQLHTIHFASVASAAMDCYRPSYRRPQPPADDEPLPQQQWRASPPPRSPSPLPGQRSRRQESASTQREARPVRPSPPHQQHQPQRQAAAPPPHHADMAAVVALAAQQRHEMARLAAQFNAQMQQLALQQNAAFATLAAQVQMAQLQAEAPNIRPAQPVPHAPRLGRQREHSAQQPEQAQQSDVVQQAQQIRQHLQREQQLREELLRQSLAEDSLRGQPQQPASSSLRSAQLEQGSSGSEQQHERSSAVVAPALVPLQQWSSANEAHRPWLQSGAQHHAVPQADDALQPLELPANLLENFRRAAGCRAGSASHEQGTCSEAAALRKAFGPGAVSYTFPSAAEEAQPSGGKTARSKPGPSKPYARQEGELVASPVRPELELTSLLCLPTARKRRSQAVY
jgi:hypothetical protein